MTQIVSLDFASWQPAVSPDAQQSAVRAVEGGGVLVLPHLAFTLDDHERRFLDARWSDGRAKNISLEGAALKGARGAADDLAQLTRMIVRFATCAADLVTALFPRYAPYAKRARTSYRDFNNNQSFDGEGDETIWPTVEQAYYRFDLARYLA